MTKINISKKREAMELQDILIKTIVVNSQTVENNNFNINITRR